MIDLATERERSLARQKERDEPRFQRRRARLVLMGRWNAGVAELAEVIEEMHPGLDEEGRAALLRECARAQAEERPKIDPGNVTYRPDPEAEPVIRTPGKRKKVSAGGLPAGSRDASGTVEGPHPGPPAPQPEAKNRPTPEQESAMAKPKTIRLSDLHPDERASVTDIVVAELATNPEATADHLRSAVAEKIGLQLNKNQVYYLRDEARSRIRRTEPAIASGNGVHPPAETAPAEPGAKAGAGAAAEEIRSLRATYARLDYVRLEEEDDVWVVRASLSFEERSEAAAVLNSLLVGVAAATVDRVHSPLRAPGGGDA